MKNMRTTPFTSIQKLLANKIPADLIEYLPLKWEKIGDVLLIKLPSELLRFREIISEIYAQVLHCKTVLLDNGNIMGVYREPNVEWIYGSKEIETVHVENGIRYKLNPQKIMFSSGNMDERIRMGLISNTKETIVDLFAGIGYFTLPLAVYSKPKKIYACEINKIAYDYLSQNIVLNDVTETVEPLIGDNREIAPENVADRVLMGYLRDTFEFLPTALNCLKNNIGVIHYHEVCPNTVLPDQPLQKIRDAAKEYDRTIKLLSYRPVKSYAPGITHAVLDVEIIKP